MEKFKYFISGIYPPYIWMHIIAYFFSSKKHIIKEDIEQWKRHTGMKEMSLIHKLSHLLVFEKPFRNLFYRRIGSAGKFINVLIPGEKTLFLTPHEIGGGFFIRHGYATFVNTFKVGKNCIIHQCTTIGDSGKGIPTIGNNVEIGTGAIILGPITIGDNVTIAAGAIVVDDIPANSVVIGNKATIVKPKIEKIK